VGPVPTIEVDAADSTEVAVQDSCIAVVAESVCGVEPPIPDEVESAAVPIITSGDEMNEVELPGPVTLVGCE